MQITFDCCRWRGRRTASREQRPTAPRTRSSTSTPSRPPWASIISKIGGELPIFLDVEGTSASNPNLSLDYWIGWSAALVAHSGRVSGGRFTVMPGVYCRQNQNPTWEAIARAASLGFPCAGAWVFRSRKDACTRPIPDWDAPFNTPAVALPCPIMLWQFAIDCLFEGGVDFDMLNPDPAVAASLLNRLALPPL